MIANSLKEGWEIIYQRSHANLAAMLVAAWRDDDHVPRWTELIIATAQHDDQEMFWSNSNHLTDIGAPMNFTQSELDTSRQQAERVIDNAYRQGLWIALLISRHNSFLYEPKRGIDDKLDNFLDTQRENQARWREQLGYTEEKVDAAYSFLRWGDRLSLILCQRQIPQREREIDITPDRHDRMIRLIQRDDDTLYLDPWVLQEDELTVSVETRRLHQLKFDSEEEFQDALDDAAIEHRQWQFKR
jgi:hypothetical protein